MLYNVLQHFADQKECSFVWEFLRRSSTIAIGDGGFFSTEELGRIFWANISKNIFPSFDNALEDTRLQIYDLGFVKSC